MKVIKTEETISNNKKWGRLLDLNDTPELEPILKPKSPHREEGENNNNNNTSKYLGVSCKSGRNRGKKWRARIAINKKVYELGLYETEEDAGRVYAKALYKYKNSDYSTKIIDQEQPSKILNNNRKRKRSSSTNTNNNVPQEEREKVMMTAYSFHQKNNHNKWGGLDLSDTPELEPILRQEYNNDHNYHNTNHQGEDRKSSSSNYNNKSKYVGVSYKSDGQRSKKWGAKISINKKYYSLGVYETEQEAGRVYAKAAYKYRVSESLLDKGFDISNIPNQPLILKKGFLMSSINNNNDNIDDIIKYMGVSKIKNSNRYRAKIKYNNREVTLGTYDTQQEAATIYAKTKYFLLQQQQQQQKKQDNNQIQQLNNQHKKQDNDQIQQLNNQHGKEMKSNDNNNNENDITSTIADANDSVNNNDDKKHNISNIFNNVDFHTIPDQPLILKKRICTSLTNNENNNNNDMKSIDDIKYQGVRRINRGSSKKFQARIGYKNQRNSLGAFNTQEEAAAMYAKADYYLRQLQQQQQQHRHHLQQQQHNDNQKKQGNAQIRQFNHHDQQQQKISNRDKEMGATITIADDVVSNNIDNKYSKNNIFDNIDFSTIPDQPLILNERKFMSLTTNNKNNDDDNNIESTDDYIKYRGVNKCCSPRNSSSEFRARIWYKNRPIILGYFNTQEEAAAIYAKAEYYLQLQQQQEQQNNDNRIQQLYHQKKSSDTNVAINTTNSHNNDYESTTTTNDNNLRFLCNNNNINDNNTNNIILSQKEKVNNYYSDFINRIHDYEDSYYDNGKYNDNEDNNQKDHYYEYRGTFANGVACTQEQQQEEEEVHSWENDDYNNHSALSWRLIPENLEYKMEGMEYATI